MFASQLTASLTSVSCLQFSEYSTHDRFDRMEVEFAFEAGDV